jgi:hypothetical protein
MLACASGKSCFDGRNGPAAASRNGYHFGLGLYYLQQPLVIMWWVRSGHWQHERVEVKSAQHQERTARAAVPTRMGGLSS